MVERPSENPGAILTRQEIFLQSAFIADYLTVSVQPPYAIACINIRASTSVHTLKSQTLATIPLFGDTKILHTLVGMESVSLGVVVYVCFPARGNEALKNKQINIKNKKTNRN